MAKLTSFLVGLLAASHVLAADPICFTFGTTFATANFDPAPQLSELYGGTLRPGRSMDISTHVSSAPNIVIKVSVVNVGKEVTHVKEANVVASLKVIKEKCQYGGSHVTENNPNLMVVADPNGADGT